MKDSKEQTKTPVVLPELLKLVEECRPVYKQGRIFNRILALVMAEIFVFGRHTLTQLLLSLGLDKEDWTAWYRLFSKGRFQEEASNGVLVKRMTQETVIQKPFVIGIDGFHVPRCSLKMPGTAWMRGLRTAAFRPGIQRGQRFVEGSWLPAMHQGFTRAIPLRCLPAFTRKSAPANESPQTEVVAGLQIIKWCRQKLDQFGRQEQGLLILADGSYDTLDFWRGLPQNCLALVRTARNRCLYHLPPAGSHGNRLYGEKAVAPHSYLKKRKAFKHAKIMIRGRQRKIRYRLEGPFVRESNPHIPLFLLIIGGSQRPKGARRKRYQPCFFLISALPTDTGNFVLPLPILEILVWLWQRWELEVAHRQMKTGLGLGEKQAWNKVATVSTVQWSVWVYSLIVLAGYLAWGYQTVPNAPGSWRKAPQRWSFNSVLRQLRCELWNQPDFKPTWVWSRDNWLGNEPHWANLFNAMLGSTRL